MKHSSVGASSAERFMNCAGSVQLIEKCPPQPESEYAKEGITAHKLAEICLKREDNPFQYVGTPIEGIVVSDEMAEAVQTYLDVIDADLKANGLARMDLQIEHQFHLTQVHPDAFGTNDANLAVFLTRVIVYDFKYGSGIAVGAEGNKLGLYYALGASLEGDYDQFEVVIVQPRAMHKAGPVRRWCVNKPTLDAFAKELKQAIALAQAKDAPLHCGQWCKDTFCAAIICCPEVKKCSEDAALMVFDAEPVSVPPKPETLSADQLKRLLDAMPVIDTYLRAVEAYALDRANKGEPVLGYKLVARRSNRKWRDESEVKKKFGEAAIKRVEEVLSPSQLETELKKVMKLKEAKAAVESLTFKPDAGNVLVPLDDPRDAVKPKLEHTFEDESLF